MKKDHILEEGVRKSCEYSFLSFRASIDVQAQALSVKVQLVPAASLLQELRDISGVFDAS